MYVMVTTVTGGAEPPHLALVHALLYSDVGRGVAGTAMAASLFSQKNSMTQ